MSEKRNRIAEVIAEEGGIKYKYVLDELVNGENTTYSIGVYMKSKGEETYDCVDGVFADKKRVIRFFYKISRHLATPIDLRYVMEDEALLI